MSEKMTKEERLDWLCRLGAFLVSVGMPNDWRAKFTQAVSDSIAELSAEQGNDTIKHETVTEFADRCKECGSRYGKLLKQKLCEDAISREETLTAFSDYVGSGMSMDDFDALWDIVAKMPAVKESKWIPVSERLPEENKTVMASTEYGVFPEAKYTKEYGWEWAYEAGADYWKELEDVTAWMPLPKPYKVDPQESEG